MLALRLVWLTPESDVVIVQVSDKTRDNTALGDLWKHPNYTSGETLSSL